MPRKYKSVKRKSALVEQLKDAEKRRKNRLSKKTLEKVSGKKSLVTNIKNKLSKKNKVKGTDGKYTLLKF